VGLKARRCRLRGDLTGSRFDRVQKTVAEDESFTFVPVSNARVGGGRLRGGVRSAVKTPALLIPTSAFWLPLGPWRACTTCGSYRLLFALFRSLVPPP
jgi:hypothetical protein